VSLGEKDYLVIVGDFINKGVNSYETLCFIEELNKRKNTIVLKGNHEYFIHYHMVNEERFAKLFQMFEDIDYETIIDALCHQMGTKFSDHKDSNVLYDQLMSNYGDVFDYLGNLPIMAVIGEFRFVHGGYDSSFDPDMDELKFLKYDNYNEHAQINDMTTITGHWPICNLHRDKLSNLPFFNEEKNIFFIDGALGVKKSGELNALVISKKDSVIEYECIQENGFIKGTIIQEHNFETEEKIYVNYPHYDIEVLFLGPKMSRCKHIHSQKEFTVFSSLLIKNNKGYELKTNFVNNFLNLKIGDEVEICSDYDDCALVKHNNEFGWIFKHQLSIFGGLSQNG
jgi:protein phosphatase